MRISFGAAILLSALCLTGCSESPDCNPPAGCLRAGAAQGTCECLEWQVTSVEAVPLKYVVLAVEYAALGEGSAVAYGHKPAPSPAPLAASELGSRFRAVVRSTAGSEHVVSLGRIDMGASGGGLAPVTATSAAFLLAGPGSAWTFTNSVDVPTTAQDRILVWVNPTLTVTTDFIGERRADWGWTAVGGCFLQATLPCDGPVMHAVLAGELDGTISPVADFYTRELLATLTAAERQDILSHDAFYDPPGRDPATLDADPRFQLLGQATVTPGASSYPTPVWTPCSGTVTDADFVPLHQSAVKLASSSDQVLLQYGVLSSEPACSVQQPGLFLATTTPGCELTASVYLDRVFGTLLTVPTSTSAACTVWQAP